MAPAIPNIKTLRVVCLILVFGINTASSGDYYGLLSKLYKKAAEENRPLILVLDNSSNDQSKNVKAQKHAYSKEYDVNNPPLIDLTLFDQVKEKKSPKNKPVKSSKTYGEEHNYERPRNRYRERKPKLRLRDYDRQGDRWDDWDRQDDWDRRENKDRRDRQRIRSPVLKSLLRISNGLACRAKDKCQNTCNNKFKGKKRDICEDKCEVKYDCEESDNDPCDGDSCEISNECGSDDACQGSTKGVTFEPEKPKCKRC